MRDSSEIPQEKHTVSKKKVEVSEVKSRYRDDLACSVTKNEVEKVKGIQKESVGRNRCW